MLWSYALFNGLIYSKLTKSCYKKNQKTNDFEEQTWLNIIDIVVLIMAFWTTGRTKHCVFLDVITLPTILKLTNRSRRHLPKCFVSRSCFSLLSSLKRSPPSALHCITAAWYVKGVETYFKQIWIPL